MQIVGAWSETISRHCFINDQCLFSGQRGRARLERNTARNRKRRDGGPKMTARKGALTT